MNAYPTRHGLLTLAALATFAALSPAPAPAQDEGHSEAARATAPGHGKALFLQENDTNHDGAVTRAEFAAARDARYRSFDGNGDGRVSEAEYVDAFVAAFYPAGNAPAGQVKQAHVRFGVLDTDKDGNLSQAEFAASGERLFNRLDSNADEIVDARDTAASF